MVKPFSEAVVKLEKGKYTKTPVQTQFGWHVILREDSRAQTPPPLASVKEQLMPYLQRKKVQNMVETLRKQAKVEILVPLTDEKPKAPANDKAAAEQPVAEEVVVEEVKNAAGKTVAEGVVVEEVVEEKAPTEASATDKAAEAAKTVEKAATEATDKVKETAKATKKAAKAAIQKTEKAVSPETKK
jgi:peptidyl-prolyl cis-trans isomerase C